MGEYKLSDNIIKLRELVKELDKDDEMSPKGLKIEKEFPLDVIKSTIECNLQKINTTTSLKSKINCYEKMVEIIKETINNVNENARTDKRYVG